NARLFRRRESPTTERQDFRISGALGRRPANGTRTVSDRRIREGAALCRELSKRDQGLLHESQRRQQNSSRDGYAGSAAWRDHRRISTRRAARRAARAHARTRTSHGELLVVPRAEKVRHGSAFRIRPWLRTFPDVRHGNAEYPRRDSDSAISG